ncbi:MAG: MBL fold metallo-hydrolase [Promethearchaeota archaeon]
MTKVRFLGGCQQVGASAVLVEHQDARVLMDYGVAFKGEHRTPLPTSTRNLTAVLSHAHLDHSGSLPLLAGSHTQPIPVYTTALTRALTRLLLKDMLRIGGETLPFEQQEVAQILSNTRALSYNQRQQISNKVFVTLRDAGHIPGSASILVEIEGNGTGPARIFYTGDLNTRNSQLVQGAPSLREIGELDLVIVESTYALTEHPKREDVEQTFIEAVLDTLESKGTVLIPAFAVGRAQEVLSVLHKHRSLSTDYPIYIDGMAKAVTKVMQRYAHSFTGGTQLQQAVEYVSFVRNAADRRQALREPAIIIAPAGMLKGGSALNYLRAIADDKRSSVLLVGKQLAGTPGAELLETGSLLIHSKDGASQRLHVQSEVKAFNFSCHIDRGEALAFLHRVKGNPKIVTMHGEADACNYLAETLQEKFGFNAEAATKGQSFTLN